MNYRKISQISFFLNVAILGIFLRHDSYNMFLAIAAGMFVYFFAFIFSGKLARFLFFVPCSIAVCQLSITLKRAIMEDGFEEVLKANPLGYLVGDIAYGFRHVVTTLVEFLRGTSEAIQFDQYSTLGSLNYRFFTIIVMIVIMTIFILKDKPSTKVEVVE